MHAPVVVLTTSETATSGVLAVLSDTSVTGRDMAAVLASLAEPCRHFLYAKEMGKQESAPSASEAQRHPKRGQSIQQHRFCRFLSNGGHSTQIRSAD